MIIYIDFVMKKKFGLTLIETLVAITVFSIGVFAVLRVLTWNLSIMDRTNMKLQSTVLAKEWLELLYNVRDSNLNKWLPWDCIMDQNIYSMDQSTLNTKIEYFGWDPKNYICAWFFGNNLSNIVQLSFDREKYLSQKILSKASDFDQLFEDNKLCLFTWEQMQWFSYCDSSDSWESTFFARYLSFSPVNISNGSLPSDKILKVESHVLYKKWHKTGDLVFESFIWNY